MPKMTLAEAIESLGGSMEEVLASTAPFYAESVARKHEQRRTRTCPVALTLAECTDLPVCVGSHSIWIENTSQLPNITSPEPVALAVRAYDYGTHGMEEPK